MSGFRVGERVVVVEPVQANGYGLGAVGVIRQIDKDGDVFVDWVSGATPGADNFLLASEIAPAACGTVLFPRNPTNDMLDLIFGHDSESARRNYDRLVAIAENL